MKSKKVLISLKEDFLQIVDKIAEEESRNRSELIREALRMYFNKRTPALNTEESPPQTPKDPFSTVIMR